MFGVKKIIESVTGHQRTIDWSDIDIALHCDQWRWSQSTHDWVVNLGSSSSDNTWAVQHWLPSSDLESWVLGQKNCFRGEHILDPHCFMIIHLLLLLSFTIYYSLGHWFILSTYILSEIKKVINDFPLKLSFSTTTEMQLLE